jgi:hypothetical protein
MNLVIRYDPKADILVVKLKEGEMVDEKLLDSDVLLGLMRRVSLWCLRCGMRTREV